MAGVELHCHCGHLSSRGWARARAREELFFPRDRRVTAGRGGGEVAVLGGRAAGATCGAVQCSARQGRAEQGARTMESDGTSGRARGQTARPGRGRSGERTAVELSWWV